MLRNRSRAVTRKQAIMADQSPIAPPSENQTRPVSSFFGSPRFFSGFLGKGPFETESMSPTSVLPCKSLSLFAANPAKFSTTFPGNKLSREKPEPPRAIGLALVDSLTDDNFPKPKTRMVLFGSKLKIQIPPTSGISHSHSQLEKSPTDFGIKTRNSKCLSPIGSANNGNQAMNGSLTVSEMELSEDYTCVITHGPNPRTTHIYDNCIVDRCPEVGSTESTKEFSSLFTDKPKFPSKNFLSSCYTCKKDLGPGKDIFIYRGEKAFCSCECRLQEILFDEQKNEDYM